MQTVYHVQQPQKNINRNKCHTTRPANILWNFWFDRKNVCANRNAQTERTARRRGGRGLPAFSGDLKVPVKEK